MLAKALCQSTHIPTDPPPSQASQLPKGICARCAIAYSSNLLLGCGNSRARARQRWRWFSQPIYQLTLSHRNQASPHLCLEMHTPVGVGLPAKALCQSTHIPTDPPPSQASQLPQGIGVRCAIACSWNLLLGCGNSRARARQRRRWFSQPIYQLNLRLRRQASTTFALKCIPLWERACSRKRCVSQHIYRLTLRLRRQASSHRGYVCAVRLHAARTCCSDVGALEPERGSEGGGSVNTSIN